MGAAILSSILKYMFEKEVIVQVNMLIGDTLELTVLNSSTIKDVKEQISQEKGIIPMSQILYPYPYRDADTDTDILDDDTSISTIVGEIKQLYLIIIDPTNIDIIAKSKFFKFMIQWIKPEYVKNTVILMLIDQFISHVHDDDNTYERINQIMNKDMDNRDVNDITFHDVISILTKNKETMGANISFGSGLGIEILKIKQLMAYINFDELMI